MMFGSSKTRAFKPVPFGQTRRKQGVPRWLILLLSGIGLGGLGTYYAQENLLPPRLSYLESQELKKNAEEAVKAKEQMSSKLDTATAQLKTAQNEQKLATDKMNSALAKVDPLKKDLEMVLKSIPPDPRGNAIAVRAGTFNPSAGQLKYHVLFTRDKATKDPFQGTMQLVVAGGRGGRETVVNSDPIKVSIENYQQLDGVQILPDGFQAREVTVKLLSGPGGAMVSMRVFRL